MNKSIWALTVGLLFAAGVLHAEESVFAGGEAVKPRFTVPPSAVGVPVAPEGLVLDVKKKPQLFRYSKYVCGKSQKARVSGSPTSCKPVSLWKEYAAKDCGKRGVLKITFREPCS